MLPDVVEKLSVHPVPVVVLERTVKPAGNTTLAKLSSMVALPRTPDPGFVFLKHSVAVT